MSFLVDIVLIGILLAVVTTYARKSIFSAGMGTLATAMAVTAALFLAPLAATPAAEITLTPLTERAVAEEFADMYSAPHLATPEKTVAALPFAQMIDEQTESYRRLLEKYHADAATVEAAYRAHPEGITVVHSIAAPFATTLTKAGVFLLISLLLTVVLQLIMRRIEQNLPPQRRYRGFKRVIPPLFGVLSGLLWSWVAIIVLSWVVPVAAEQLVFLTPAVLQQADWYRWLHSISPLALLERFTFGFH